MFQQPASGIGENHSAPIALEEILPNSTSSWRTWRLSTGCTTDRKEAARVKLPSSATWRK